MAKAEGAYGDAILMDLDRALDRLKNRHGWLERCMQVLLDLPKTLVWQRLGALRRVFPSGGDAKR